MASRPRYCVISWLLITVYVVSCVVSWPIIAVLRGFMAYNNGTAWFRGHNRGTAWFRGL